MNIGKLRDLIEIKEKIVDRNEFGEESISYESYRKVWAYVKDVEAREFFSNAGVEQEIRYQILIRKIEGIKPNMIVVYKDKQLEITGIADLDNTNRFLILSCKEISNG